MSEPAWLQSIISVSKGDDDDINMNIGSDNAFTKQAESSSSSSELEDITFLEIGDFTTPSSTTWFSPQGHSLDREQRLQNIVIFANLNPGYGILNQQLQHLTQEPILQTPQPEEVVQEEALMQHPQNVIGMSRSSNSNRNQGLFANDYDDGAFVNAATPDAHSEDHQLSVAQGSPRAPLAILQTNTPHTHSGSGTSTPTHFQDNNTYTGTHPEFGFHLEFHANQHPSHSIQTNRKNYSKPSQSVHSGSSQPSTSTPGQPVSPAHPQRRHAHTTGTTTSVHTGLGAYSKSTDAQPPRPVTPSPLPSRPAAAVPSISAHPLPTQPLIDGSSRVVPDALNHDVEMEPPASESESEDGEIVGADEDQVDELMNDGSGLEEGEIDFGRSGPIEAALSSHIAVFRAAQASGAGSSSAVERRQLARRERRAGVLGLGVIGRGRGDTSERTGTGASRLGGAIVERARTTHVPSIAGHIQHPPVATLESPLVHPATTTKPCYPLPIDTVHSWRTELERLASLCMRPGAFKNMSQYAAELNSVLKQIEDNEEHPDLTVEVLLETRLMQVLRKFRHHHEGPGVESMVPRVKRICERCKERLRKMEVEEKAREIEANNEMLADAATSGPVDNSRSQARG